MQMGLLSAFPASVLASSCGNLGESLYQGENEQRANHTVDTEAIGRFIIPVVMHLRWQQPRLL